MPASTPEVYPVGSQTAEGRLRVGVLTRTGRTSGMRFAEAVLTSSHALCGVIAEKRWTMIRSLIRRRSMLAFLRDYVPGAIMPRLWDGVVRNETSTTGQLTAVPSTCRHVVRALNSPETIALLTRWQPDLLIVANAPIVSDSIVACARMGAVNFHSGRLPQYGGVASEFWSLYEQQEMLFATIHRLTSQLDSGDILAEWPIEIRSGDTPGQLHARAIDVAVNGIGAVLDRLAAGTDCIVRRPGPAVCRRWPTVRQCLELRRRLQATQR